MTCSECGEPAVGQRCRGCIRDAEREGDTIAAGVSDAGPAPDFRPGARDPAEREWLRRRCGHLSTDAPCMDCLEERRRLLDDPRTIRVPTVTAHQAMTAVGGGTDLQDHVFAVLSGNFPGEWSISPAGSEAFATAAELRADGAGAYQCQGCDEEFETLSRKRLHQQDDCPGQFDYVDAGDRDTDAVVAETVEALLTCQQCEAVHEGEIERRDGPMDEDPGVEIKFVCAECGFVNENSAVPEGAELDRKQGGER